LGIGFLEIIVSDYERKNDLQDLRFGDITLDHAVNGEYLSNSKLVFRQLMI